MARTSTTWTKETAPKGNGKSKEKRTQYKDILKIMYEQDAGLFHELFFSTEGLDDETIHKKVTNSDKFSLWQKMQISALYKAISKGDMRAIQAMKEQFMGKPKEHTHHSGEVGISYDPEITKVLAQHFIKKYRKEDRGR